jgi:tRNA 2-thiouridine synthesizing protein A
LKHERIDTRGRSCPEPVLLTQQALKQLPRVLQVVTDNTTARGNVIRFAKSSGYRVEAAKEGSDDILTLVREDS